MDQLYCTVDEVIKLSSALLNATVRLKDLISELKPNSWQYNQPSLQEIYERRQAALEHYRQQYELEKNGDDDAFESGEDEIDSKSEQKQQMPIEAYYTRSCRRFSQCSDENWPSLLRRTRCIKGDAEWSLCKLSSSLSASWPFTCCN